LKTTIKESKPPYDSIIQGIPDIIYRLDPRGKITFVNNAVMNFGYYPEELIGTDILELVHPRDRKKASYRINERRTGDRRTASLELRLCKRPTSDSPLELVARDVEEDPVFLVTAEGIYESEKPETRAFAGTQGIARDITALQMSRNRFRRQTRFLVRILEALPYPFYVINAADYTVSFANAAANLYRSSKQATCYALTHQKNTPCDSVGHPCPLEEIKKTKKPVVVEHIHYDKEGNPRNVEIHAYPVFNPQGGISQIIESALDVTERRRFEKEREKLIGELQDALSKVKTLRGLIPICASCKKIRDDKGYWNQIESFVREHSHADFTHGICPECAAELYPELQQVK
jgi:PAS domain S-box-containing protein